MKVRKYDAHENETEIEQEESLIGFHATQTEPNEDIENEEEEISEVITTNIRLDQIIPIVIYLGILLVFNIMTFFSDTFAYWITEGEFLIDTTILLGMIINIGMILLLILFIIYLPKMNRTILNQIGMFLLGVLIGLLFYLIFINNGIELKLGEIIFPFFNLVILIPILILAIYYQVKTKCIMGIRLATLVFGILIIIVILDIPNYILIVELINYPMLLSFLIVFESLSIIYIVITNKYQYKIEKQDKIVKIKILSQK